MGDIPQENPLGGWVGSEKHDRSWGGGIPGQGPQWGDQAHSPWERRLRGWSTALGTRHPRAGAPL